MEIQTTEDIVGYHEETTPDGYAMKRADLPKFRKINDKFWKKKWVAVDDVNKQKKQLKETIKKHITFKVIDDRKDFLHDGKKRILEIIDQAFQDLNSQSNENKKEEK